MRRHEDSCWHLHKAITRTGDRFDRKTLQTWSRGTKGPADVYSFEILARIERRYRLPEGCFKSKLCHPGRAARGHQLKGISPSERRRLAWHLPDDFERRPAAEQKAILAWVRTVIISGSTDYRRFLTEAMKHRYALRFPALSERSPAQRAMPIGEGDDQVDDIEPELITGTVDAPPRLADEMVLLVTFKTATLTDIGFRRSGVWEEATSAQKIEHLGLMFGALAASLLGKIEGHGVPLASLTFAMLVFPRVWDWYVQWRERRRGFYTTWEVDMLRLALALTRADTGWLRQNPQLADRLEPIAGLISEADIDRARADWAAACDVFYRHGQRDRTGSARPSRPV